jgi:hypothetical protein
MTSAPVAAVHSAAHSAAHAPYTLPRPVAPWVRALLALGAGAALAAAFAPLGCWPLGCSSAATALS